MQRRYYKSSEVAKLFGVHNDTVKKWCTHGDIDSNLVGGAFYIPIEAIEPHKNGFKPRRVLTLEKRIEVLEAKIMDYKRQMRVVAGMLLQIEGDK